MLFSLIVPVYNVKKYLRDCIFSIRKQLFKDYEVIIIDDGSTDGSGEICDEYAKDSPSNWTVLHEKNGGLSFARNQGIKRAKGDYIVLLDSDDFLKDENALINLKNVILNVPDKRPDVIISSSYGYYDDSHSFKIRYWNEHGTIINGIHAMQSIFDCKSFVVGPWILTVSRKFFFDNNLWFKEGVWFEDDLWVPQVLCSTDNIYVNQHPFYCNRCDRPDSTTYNIDKKKIEDKITILDELDKYSLRLDKRHRRIINRRCAQMMVGIIQNAYSVHDDYVNKQLNERAVILTKSDRPKYHILFFLCKIIGIERVERLVDKYC